MPYISITGLTKRFSANAGVQGIDLAIEKGEALCLLGASGCGKTTLLRLVAGLLVPDRGRIELDGRDITELPAYRRDIGMVFQTWALFPHLTVSRNIEFGLKLRHVDAAMRKRRVGELLDLVGLSALAERMPRQLSGGQQQRVALARALVTNPRVLLLDEPMSSLDFNTRTQLRQELRALQREVGVTAIYVTHDYSEAVAVADRTVLMHDGVIVEQAPTRALFKRPRTRFAAEFLNLHNVLHGEVVAASAAGVRIRLNDAATVSVPGDAFADGVPMPGTRIALGFDQWDADFREGEAAACAFGGCVEQTAIESGHTRFVIRLDGGLGLFNVRRPGLSELPKGTRCAVTLDGTKSWPLRD